MTKYTEQPHEIKGELALVTGAGSGVGQAIAAGLAKEGVKVVLAGRNEHKLKRTESLIHQAGGTAYVMPADVNRMEDVWRMSGQVLQQLGTPSILINGAGVHGEMRRIADSDPEKWIQTFMINTVGPYLVCRAFLNHMLELNWGRIINITSASSLGTPSGLNSAYPTSKVALNHFTRQLAADLEGTGITANVIHPGEVKTQMWADIRDDAQNSGIEGAIRWAEMVAETGGDSPEKSVKLVLDLLKPEAGNINGKFLWIEEGLQKPKPSWD